MAVLLFVAYLMALLNHAAINKLPHPSFLAAPPLRSFPREPSLSPQSPFRLAFSLPLPAIPRICSPVGPAAPHNSLLFRCSFLNQFPFSPPHIFLVSPAAIYRRSRPAAAAAEEERCRSARGWTRHVAARSGSGRSGSASCRPRRLVGAAAAGGGTA